MNKTKWCLLFEVEEDWRLDKGPIFHGYLADKNEAILLREFYQSQFPESFFYIVEEI